MRLTLKLILLSTLFLLYSCGEDTINSPDPISTANIIGSINLYDEGVNQVDNSGMRVKIENISPSMYDTTDIDGNFVLQDVPFGTYTLVFEKSGYGTYKHINLEHTNTGSSTIINPTPSLGQLSTTKIVNLSATVSASEVSINVSTDPEGSIGNTRYIRCFYSKDSNVSHTNYSSYSPGLISQINPYTLKLTSSELDGMGFQAGSTVYIKVYGESFWSNEYDDESGQKVFPNLNPVSADAVSFVVQ